jgi:hypothetical protein
MVIVLAPRPERNPMRKRIPTFLIAAVALAAFGGTAGIATAKHGADDPAGHVRGGHGADDRAGHVRHSSRIRAKHARHGADDGPGHRRHGADDGPNHT